MDWQKIKYSNATRFGLQRLLDAGAALDLPPSCANSLTAEAFQGLINTSLAKSTWQKYASGWNAFCEFEVYHDTSFSWPLSRSCWRLFATWCITVRKLQPSSTKSYFSALKFVHHVKGVPCLDPKDDYLMKLALRGAANAAFAAPARPSTRRIVSLPLLALLGHRIGSTSWSDLSKQTVWSACTLAFFSAARMGELLASEVNLHDPTADLTWADVQFPSEDSILVRLKCTKSSDVQGEFLDIFPFENFGCCPVASLKRLLLLQQDAGVYDPAKPVFRFADGRNLTQPKFNEILSSLLSDLCLPGQDTISCHSFRSGIPSTLAMFPDLAHCDDIQGWGRWHSDCFNRYTRLRHDQKKAIFGKISAALLQAHGTAMSA